MNGLKKVFDQAKQFWTGLDKKQRIMLAGGATVTVGILLVFVRMLTVPDYKPLFTDLKAEDAQALASQLTAKNIPNQISPDGKTVSVPADRIDAARLDIASQEMPRSGRMGFELFDKLSWGQTEFDEKVNYQRALEGELERTIQTLHDVDSVRVHLVMQSDSVFIDRVRPAKASVILKLRRASLAPDTYAAITRLVAGAVDGLAPENVSVIDADTNRPLGPQTTNIFAGGGDQEMTQRLVATLEPIIGVDRVKASVNVEYDPSTMDENQEQYDPNVSVALTMQRSEEQVGSGSLGGVPGTSSNVPGAKNAAGKKQATAADPYDSTNQVSKSESATYGVNRVVRHKMSPAGRVKRISAAVLIDDADVTTQQNGKTVTMRQKRTPDELKQIEQLAKTAIGLDETRGDAITVQNLSFVRPPAEEFPTPSRIDKIRTRLSDYSNYIRYAALLLLFAIAYLLMIRPIKKQALAALRQQAPAQVEGAPAAQPLPGANLEAAPALPDHSQETATLKERLLEKIKSEPAVSSRVIQAWLHEEEA